MDWKTLKLVYVEWLDHVSMEAWEDLKDIENEKPHVIRSVGILINEDKDTLVIFMNADEEAERASMCMVICKPLIIYRKDVLIKKAMGLPSERL